MKHCRMAGVLVGLLLKRVEKWDHEILNHSWIIRRKLWELTILAVHFIDQSQGTSYVQKSGYQYSHIILILVDSLIIITSDSYTQSN